MVRHKILYLTLLLFSIILTESLADELSVIEKEQIFKDKLGYDTGMSNEELDLFKNNYAKKLKILGLLKFPVFFVKSYQSKLNLLKIEELRDLGLPFDSLSIYHGSGAPQLLNILMSDFIVVGTIDKIEFLYNSKEEEMSAKSDRNSKYHVKIEEILKGENDFKNLENELSFYSCIGKYVWCSDGVNYLLNAKYLMYIDLVSNPIDSIPELVVHHKSSLEIDDNELFYTSRNFNKKSKYAKTFSEMKSIIKKYLEINDSENFYKREYNGKNEK